MIDSRMRGLRPDPYYGLLLLLTGFGVAPLLAPAFIGSHDGLLAVYRLLELHRALSEGPFPPRWAPDFFFGYGFPFFNYYAPLAYYFGEALHLAGASLPDAVELTFAAGFVVSAWATYALTRQFLARRGALLAAVAYVYFPYHLVDSHFRGDLSEFFALAWFPAILWALGRALRQGGIAIPLAALLYAALILTHNVMALVFSPVILAYGLWIGCWLPAFFLRLAAVVLLSWGLAAFFWLPALAEKETVQIEHTLDDPSVDYHNHFAANLLSRDLLQRYAFRQDGTYRYEVQAGLVQVGLAVLGALRGIWLVMRGVGATHASPLRAPLVFFTTAAVCFWFLMTPASLPLWDAVPLMPFVQFPWRFLALFGLATAVLTGYLGEGHRGQGQGTRNKEQGTVSLAGLFHVPNPWFPTERWTVVTLLAIIATIGASVINLHPRYMLLEAEDLTLAGLVRFELLSQAIGTTSIGEYLPRGVTQRPVASSLAIDYLREGRLNKVDPRGLGEGASVEIRDESGTALSALVRSSGGRLVIRTPDWPHWRAYLNGQPVPVVPTGPQGFLGIDVPAGEHQLQVRLEDTPLRTAANTISLASLGLVAVGIGWTAYRRRGKKGKRGKGITGKGEKGIKPGFPGPFSLFSFFPFFLTLVVLLIFTWLTIRPGDLEANPAGARYPLRVELGGQVELLGYDLQGPEGGDVDLTLYWRPTRPLEKDYHTFLHLAGITGQIWGQGDRRTGPPDRPTTTWGPGEVVADRYRITPRPGTPPGVYQIGLGLYDGTTMQRLPVSDERLTRALFPEGVIRIGPLVRGRPAEGVSPAHPSRVRFEEYVRLLGYEVEGEEGDHSPVAVPPAGPALLASPGQEIRLTLYWQALRSLDRDFTAFVHLLDGANQVVSQQDNQPALGAYPTSAWREGEVVADQYELQAPATPGRYWIELGLYLAPSGQRIGVDDGRGNFVGDRLLLREVLVR